MTVYVWKNEQVLIVDYGVAGGRSSMSIHDAIDKEVLNCWLLDSYFPISSINRYGRFIRNGFEDEVGWCACKAENYPPEFKMALMLLGVE